MRQDFEQNLRQCASLVMVYGKATKPAAKAQVLECLKVAGRRQPTGRSIGAWFVVAGPPVKPNCSLDLFFDGLREIDCSRDLETPLVAALMDATEVRAAYLTGHGEHALDSEDAQMGHAEFGRLLERMRGQSGR